RSLGARRGGDAIQHDLAGQRARQDHFGVAHLLANDAGLLEYLHIDVVDGQLFQIGKAHFGEQMAVECREATLGEATLQRHLTAFEADLVETARTRLLTLVTTATGLAQARADATADTALGVLGALCGLKRIESNGFFHCFSFRPPTRRPDRPPCGSCRALQACRPALSSC